MAVDNQPGDWTGERLYGLHTSGGGPFSWRQLVEQTGLSLGQCRGRVRDYLNNLRKARVAITTDEPLFCGIPVSDLVSVLRKEPCSYGQLSSIFDRSERTIKQIVIEMIEAGYGIVQDQRRVVLPDRPVVDFSPEPLFRVGRTAEVAFALISDTHGGSHCEQVTALRDFVNIAYEEYGVKHVLHAGDVFAGRGVYRGQSSEVYAVNGRDQADTTAHNLPQKPGLRWYVMGGNHDYSFYKLAGLDARRELPLMGRDDITLLPFDAVDVPLLPGIDAKMWHPAGGVPYALSYRGQKGAEQIAQDELMQVVMGDKPSPTIRLVLIGHLHVMYLFDFGPMVVIGAGCFEGQNSLLKRKQLVPHIGGWVLRCKFVDGMLHRITPERIRYKEIENDWQPYWSQRQVRREVERMEPIFSIPR